MNRLFWSLAWYWASCLNTAASLALLVPAPSSPRPKMAAGDLRVRVVGELGQGVEDGQLGVGDGDHGQG